MTAAPPEIPIAGPADSLEVRWIAPGPLVTAMREWFARFPARMETRADAYLLVPRLPGLSVKLRDGNTLDVKSYLGSPGFIDLPYRCRGRLESWRKWSFRFEQAAWDDVLPAGWSMVRKRRHRIWFPAFSPDGPRAAEAGCAVELTQACVRGEPWWTLGFEATGSGGLLRDALDHTASLLFAQPPPAGIEFGLDSSRSYLDWLAKEAGTDAGRDDGSALGAAG